jgi:hypothetical protein
MVSDFIFRLRALLRRSAVENELDEELRFHIEQQVEKHVRGGQSREEAVKMLPVRDPEQLVQFNIALHPVQ